MCEHLYHNKTFIFIGPTVSVQRSNSTLKFRNIRRAQVKVGLINLCKGLFSLNARIYYKLKSGT
jgi:hypothetical protein